MRLYLAARPALLAVSAAIALAASSGCAKVSPAVGTWTGAAATSTATVVLKADGTGTVSIPPVMQDKPVTWKEEADKKVTIQMGGSAGAAATPGAPAAGANFSLTGTLAEDAKTMTVPFPMFQLTLTKQADK